MNKFGEKVRNFFVGKWWLLSFLKRILNGNGKECTIIDHSRHQKVGGP